MKYSVVRQRHCSLYPDIIGPNVAYLIMYCKSPKTSQRPQQPRQGDQLITGAIPNQVGNYRQTSRFVLVPGKNSGRLSRGDSVGLRLQSVMMADVWWRRSGIGVGYVEA